MEFGLVRDVKDFLRGQYKKDRNMFAWRIRHVRLTKDEEIVVSFVGFKNVYPLGWLKKLFGQTP